MRCGYSVMTNMEQPGQRYTGRVMTAWQHPEPRRVTGRG
jgi:hypothetical protein